MSSASLAADSYGQDVSVKLGSGLANIVLGWIEIPKNMLNTTNQTNVALGFTGGLFKGILHTAGRTGAGLVDFLTFPVPTKPITQPRFVWEDFYTETRYGPAMQIKDR